MRALALSLLLAVPAPAAAQTAVPAPRPAAGAAAGAEDAETRSRALRYAVDWGPAALAEIEFRITERAGRTTLAAEARSTGLLSLFADFEAEQTALHGPAGPEEFTTRATWDDKRSARRVRFGDGPPQAETLVAPEDEDEPRTPIPPGALDDAVDPTFPILRAMRQVERGEGCAVSHPVFTGRTAFHVTLSDMGEEALEADRSWTWSGLARRCRMAIQRIGGFKIEDDGWDQDEEDVTRDIWFGPLPEALGGGIAPVRMLVEWPLGYAVGRIDLR
ncbi:DUF3108 domain-containing protein [Rhodovulum sp. DZ06]|uniref:DUF3108 domain-containing protein n=1 Tax=Rhodovulum sp. DZ06 TaxID=3425126 RepID=UPI003D339497